MHSSFIYGAMQLKIPHACMHACILFVLIFDVECLSSCVFSVGVFDVFDDMYRIIILLIIR